MASGRVDRVVISGVLWRKPPKKGRSNGWQQRYFELMSDGRFIQRPMAVSPAKQMGRPQTLAGVNQVSIERMEQDAPSETMIDPGSSSEVGQSHKGIRKIRSRSKSRASQPQQQMNNFSRSLSTHQSSSQKNGFHKTNRSKHKSSLSHSKSGIYTEGQMTDINPDEFGIASGSGHELSQFNAKPKKRENSLYKALNNVANIAGNRKSRGIGLTLKKNAVVGSERNLVKSSNQVQSVLFLQQRTKIYSSEYRDFCFEICTPSEKKVVLAASSAVEKSEWIEALKRGCRNAPPRTIKIVLVGSDRNLQQKLLHAFFKECGQEQLAEEVSTFSHRADNVELTLNLEVTQEKVKLCLSCVGGEDEYANLRILHYVDAHAFMLCYNPKDQRQFEDIEAVWYPEVKPHVEKGASLFLCALSETSPTAFGTDHKTSASSIDLFRMNLYGGGSRTEKMDDEYRAMENVDPDVVKVLGEEFAEFLGALFYNVDISYTPAQVPKLPNLRDSAPRPALESTGDMQDDALSRADPSEDGGPLYESPAETFLDILQNTIEQTDGSIIDESQASVDVARVMEDFPKSVVGSLLPKSIARKVLSVRMSNITSSSFLGFIKKKTTAFADAVSSNHRSNKGGIGKSRFVQSRGQPAAEYEEAEPHSYRRETSSDAATGLNSDTVGTLKKLKGLFKTFRPKKPEKKRKVVNEEEQQRAHYVSRSQTGSLIFLDPEDTEPPV